MFAIPGQSPVTVTPAAAPHATKSRFSWSLRKGWNLVQEVSKPMEVDLPCESPAAAPQSVRCRRPAYGW